MGRPTKLDDLTAKRIVDAVRAGVSLRGAAEGARIAKSTLMDWLAAGRRGEKPYADFADRVGEAAAGAEREMVDALFASAKEGNARAAEFWLKARRVTDWASTTAGDESADAADEQNLDDLDVARSVVAALESRRKVAG